jgi:hypothetical protein
MIAEWDGDQGSATPAPAAAPSPVAPGTSNAAAPPPPPDSAGAIEAEIQAIRDDKTHPFHHGAAWAKAHMDALYQRLHGASAAPAFAATDQLGWPAPASAVVAELKDMCSREGHLPPFEDGELTSGQFDSLVESCVLTAGDADEAKWLVSQIGLALWNSSEMESRSPEGAAGARVGRRLRGEHAHRRPRGGGVIPGPAGGGGELRRAASGAAPARAPVGRAASGASAAMSRCTTRAPAS